MYHSIVSDVREMWVTQNVYANYIMLSSITTCLS